MKFTVRAVPQAEYDEWVAKQPKGRPYVQGTLTTEEGNRTTTSTLTPTTTVPVTEVRSPADVGATSPTAGGGP
jgi:heme/copper-type cytochrome/quinol oxidase subunit 2